jgi:hypothetical protein
MPTPEIIVILDRLNHAYPEKRLDKRTMKIYLEELADIPAPLLDKAVSRHIQTSPWFPHVSDLRQVAHQLAGTTHFSSISAPGVDCLALEAHQLENGYFYQGDFDINIWEGLAAQFERVGRHHRAFELRQKAQHIQAIESVCERGEEYPPSAERLRYAVWDTFP